MTDPKILHKKFKKLGLQRHKLLNEMMTILPGIYKSGIYKKYASSIFEYALKFGGIPKSTVQKRLRLEKHLYDKPALKAAIREVGVNKVAMIATIATPETEKMFADKIKNMSKPAVQTLSKELRQKTTAQCCAVGERIKVELDEEMTFLFLRLKNKFGKQMSNKQIMKMILEKMIENEFSEKRKRISGNKTPKSLPGENFSEKHVKTKPKQEGRVIENRYIQVHKRKKSLAQTNHKCAYPNCNRPATTFHHTDRFSVSKSHKSIIPLCSDHHEFAHNGLILNEKQDSINWEIDIKAQVSDQADILYREYRQEAIF